MAVENLIANEAEALSGLRCDLHSSVDPVDIAVISQCTNPVGILVNIISRGAGIAGTLRTGVGNPFGAYLYGLVERFFAAQCGRAFCDFSEDQVSADRSAPAVLARQRVTCA